MIKMTKRVNKKCRILVILYNSILHGWQKTNTILNGGDDGGGGGV